MSCILKLRLAVDVCSPEVCTLQTRSREDSHRLAPRSIAPEKAVFLKVNDDDVGVSGNLSTSEDG
jgi:hypothetical protein